MVEQVFMMLIGNVNVFLFSLYNDQIVAAIGLADQVLAIGTMAMGIVSLGATILFLQNADLDRLDYFQGVARQSFLLNVCLGLLIGLLALTSGYPIMSLMQTPHDILAESVTYFRIVSFSLAFQAISTSASALMRSFGKVQVAMTVSIINTLLVISGNALVLLTPFGLFGQGIMGISVATLFTRFLGAVLSLLCIRHILPKVWKGLGHFQVKDWQIGQRMLALGIPSGMENVSYNFSQTIITAVIASLGTIQVNARIYTQTITAIVFTLSVAAGQAVQVIVGRLVRRKEVKQAQAFAVKTTFSFMGLGLILNLLLAFFGPWILGIFTQNSEIIAIARILLWLNALYDPARVGNEIMIASLNVMGDVRYPVVIAVIVTYLFTVPAAFLIGRVWHWGIAFIWLVFIIDEGFRLWLFIRRWNRGQWMEQALYYQKDDV